MPSRAQPEPLKSAVAVRGPPTRNTSTVISAEVHVWRRRRVRDGISSVGAGQGDRSDPTASALARTELRLSWSGCQRSPRSAVVGRRSRTRPAASADHEPTRRADGPPDCLLCASMSLKPSRPSRGTRAGKRARNLRTINPLGRGHRADGMTPVKHCAGPAVKTGDPCLSPRGADRAVGGIRAWAGNPGRRASSCSTVLLRRAFMCPRPQSLPRPRP